MRRVTSSSEVDDNTRQLQEANERLRREVAAHEATLHELEAVRRELELRVIERTKELSLVKARFETALRGAKVHVSSQDLDLRYTWVYTPDVTETGADMLGRHDEEILPVGERDAVIALKRRVIATGVPADCEVSYVLPGGSKLVALHVDPTYGPDGAVDGIMCAAVDVSQVRSLESEQRRLAGELSAVLQRYDTALRGSHVTVFTQDSDLRYLTISNPFLNRSIEEIVGRTDDDIVPALYRDQLVGLKRRALESGQSQHSEIEMLDDQGKELWFDLYVEPLKDLTGEIVGITCAAVDITERKESEAHLRLLMRELTHRSKNLLAVIQAMARQTARYAGTTEGFLERFGARLQALATSHDLLVQESWYGASLHDLVKSQLGHYLDRAGSQILMEGPPILLKPEAAQGLGLALHELATNAAKYGALSSTAGRVLIKWNRIPAADGHGLNLLWEEQGGPDVQTPERRGFGLMVIERNLARSLDAQVELTFAATGARCTIVIPVTQFLPAR
jgi:PAS domain S-box-containing protein